MDHGRPITTRRTQNHDGGQNVLYVDGSVKWQGTNYCSNDPIDNIFIEGGIDAKGNRVYWNADTDSFLVNGSADADAVVQRVSGSCRQ